MFKQNRSLLIIALIAVVNALGYGIIIPIQYSYSKFFGLSVFQFGLLFALFSLCQFLSTPLIGRLSDKYGRKPLLVISIAGTAISFLMMAFAPSAIWLFIARALDGITAGNIPVASAVISDTTTPENRAKGFGIIGASFGFGFIFGPAISGLSITVANNYGLFGRAADAIPFIIAGVIAALATILTMIYLPETNKHIGDVKSGKLFDFSRMYHALFYPNIGVTLLITLFYSLGFALFIYAFQAFSDEILHLNTGQVSLLFTMYGVIGLVGQLLLVQRVSKAFGLKRAFNGSLFLAAFAFLLMFFSHSIVFFIIASVILGISNAVAQPLTQAIISRETDEKSQGSILGINASYMSIGQILGPILGGIVATLAIPYPFLAASVFTFLCCWLSFYVLRPGVKKESAF